MSPTTASSLLINAYVGQLERKVGWDFEDESPGRDARGFAREGSMPPEVETHLVNAVLTNGARYYVDHAHPEYSTPECSNALELVVHDRAGELDPDPLDGGRQPAPAAGRGDRDLQEQLRRQGQLLRLPRELSRRPRRPVLEDRPRADARTSSPGRSTPAPARSARRSPTAGDAPVFQLSQRADFFEEEVGLETTLKRPIINTRDEPHADPQKYRRLHVIVGDANLAEVATFLKVGVTALVLAMIEDDFHAGRDLTLARPVAAIRAISRDTTLRTTVELASGEMLTALELQWELYDLARKYAAERGLEALGDEEVGRRVLDRWEAVLHGLESDPPVPRRPARLGRQAPSRRGLPGAPRSRLGRPEARRARPAVPRPSARQVALRTPGDGAAHRRRGGDAGNDRAAGDDAGLLPRPLPRAVLLRDRGGQLGLGRVRHRGGSAAPRADDGAAERDGTPCRYALRRMRESGRATQATGLIRNGDGRARAEEATDDQP